MLVYRPDGDKASLLLVLFLDKDVLRTDRTLKFFEGDNNPNISVLYDILLTHCMYNFDLGNVYINHRNVV